MNDKTIIHDLALKRIAANTQIASLNAELKIFKKELMEIDADLLKEMNEAQQTMTRIDGHTISVTSQDLFTPTDWADFETFVENNKCAYLYQRRLTQKAVAEAIELFKDVPVEKFTKRSISVRKVPGTA